MNTQELQKLVAGNQRFVNGETIHTVETLDAQRRANLNDQHPFAIILGCSDSRVPAEMIFDQGLGDLFVVRVAGNVVTPTQLGSIEYAVTALGSPLVVVLGHAGCGAVKATIGAMSSPDEPMSDNIRSLVECIQPAIEPMLKTKSLDELKLDDAIKANVQTSMADMLASSEIIESRVRGGQLQVVGASYHLDSGLVEFYD